MEGQWLLIIGGAALLFVGSRYLKLLHLVRRASDVVSAVEIKPPFATGSTMAFSELAELGEALTKMATSVTEQLSRLEQDRHRLNERSRLLETVFSAMAEGVIAFDSSERVLFINESAMPLLDVEQVEQQDVVNRPMIEVTRNVSVQKFVRAALRGHSGSPVELEIGRSEKSLRIVAQRLPGQPSPGVVLIFHDVTKIRRLEAVRRDFVSNVSHELKTPLASIRAYTETLLNGAINDTENNLRFVDRIDEQAFRLHELIADLLSLASIEAQESNIETQSISVRAAVERCVENHIALVDVDNVELVISSDDECQVIATDNSMDTIFNNLIINAIKFTNEGTIRLSWQQHDQFVHIDVEDSGIGIAEENQERVFERFFRSDSARSRDKGGTGLGLAIVKHVVQSLNGQVQLASELGTGSCFTIVLPRAGE